ncbi:DUF6274 family protein [Streptomyces sp. NPDC058171]
MAPVARHETRALLRAHLSAASRYRHRVRHCPVCTALQKLATEPSTHPTESREDPEPEIPPNE